MRFEEYILGSFSDGTNRALLFENKQVFVTWTWHGWQLYHNNTVLLWFIPMHRRLIFVYLCLYWTLREQLNRERDFGTNESQTHIRVGFNITRFFASTQMQNAKFNRPSMFSIKLNNYQILSCQDFSFLKWPFL